ncbi:translation initiation factor [Ghiorsea bivora]|uniref:translation initiation factor n=1 Tax=Ghiorsea bivora TaxID=1485545 RepID=UPI00056E94D9|nr:translation initiation factor [Ghiorsea bivora]
MSSDRVLVYSSEDGMINKSSQPSAKVGKRGKKKKGTAPSPIKNPNKQGVRIMRESKGRGGKSVSVITGLSLDKDALKKLGKTLKAQLGTGGAIKDNNIEIQGDHREKLLELLDKQGIKAKIAGG